MSGLKFSRPMRSLGLGLVALLVAGAIILTGAREIPFVQTQSCRFLVWAAEIREFGTDGDDGQPGQVGRDGRAGSNQTVTATSSPMNLNLAGKDGEDGRSGERGERPYCHSQPRDVAYNLQAANGGDGGDGGNGGNGGSGGMLTLYYADPTTLRQVAVDARGGRGGRGGQGGRGVAGCQCDRDDWTIQTRTGTPGTPGYSCHEERYSCRDGRDGDDGDDGRDGQDGQPGQVRLVNQLQPLPSETPSLTRPLGELVNQSTTLSKNLWEAKTGIAALLAPGSQVTDQYLLYRGHVEGQARIVWQAPRPITAFAGEGVSAAIADSGSVGLTFPEAIWVAGDYSQQGALTTFTVTGAVRASDTTRLTWGTPQGRGRDFTLSVVDLGRESAFLTTQFRITLSTTEDDPGDSRPQRYTVRYDDSIPAELVTRDSDRFVLAIGRLPINGGTFRRGTLARVELKAVRSLGNRSAEQSLSWNGQF